MAAALEPYLKTVAYEFSKLDGAITTLRKQVESGRKQIESVTEDRDRKDAHIELLEKLLVEHSIALPDAEHGSDDGDDGGNSNDDDGNSNADDQAWMCDWAISASQRSLPELMAREEYVHTEGDAVMDYYPGTERTMTLELRRCTSAEDANESLLHRILHDGKSGCYIFNQNQSHWVALFYDGAHKEVVYFDSLGKPINPTLEQAIAQATAASSHEWTTRTMLDTPLQNDGYTCGVWCLSAEQKFVEYLQSARTTSFAESIEWPDDSTTAIAQLRARCFDAVAKASVRPTLDAKNRYFAQQLGMDDFDVKLFQTLPDDIALQVSMAESLSEFLRSSQFLRSSPTATPRLVIQPPEPPEPATTSAASTTSTAVVATTAVVVGAAAVGAAQAAAAVVAVLVTPATLATPTHDDTQIHDIDEVLNGSSMTQGDQGYMEDDMDDDMDDYMGFDIGDVELPATDVELP